MRVQGPSGQLGELFQNKSKKAGVWLSGGALASHVWGKGIGGCPFSLSHVLTLGFLKAIILRVHVSGCHCLDLDSVRSRVGSFNTDIVQGAMQGSGSQPS